MYDKYGTLLHSASPHTYVVQYSMVIIIMVPTILYLLPLSIKTTLSRSIYVDLEDSNTSYSKEGPCILRRRQVSIGSVQARSSFGQERSLTVFVKRKKRSSLARNRKTLQGLFKRCSCSQHWVLGLQMGWCCIFISPIKELPIQ